MDWTQVLTVIAANIGFSVALFLWIRTEANADRREFRAEMSMLAREMQTEMKDFHGRLCAIEERSKLGKN